MLARHHLAWDHCLDPVDLFPLWIWLVWHNLLFPGSEKGIMWLKYTMQQSNHLFKDWKIKLYNHSFLFCILFSQLPWHKALLYYNRIAEKNLEFKCKAVCTCWAWSICSSQWCVYKAGTYHDVEVDMFTELLSGKHSKILWLLPVWIIHHSTRVKAFLLDIGAIPKTYKEEGTQQFLLLPSMQ